MSDPTPPSTGDPARTKSTFTVRDLVDVKVLKRELSFSPTDLTSAMTEQASLFAHYGNLAAQASHQVDVIKLLLENTEAAVYKIERDRIATAGEKITEALLDKIVTRHSRVIAMKKSLNEAKRVEATAKIAMEGFQHRRDMLVQQGLIQREEMKGDVVIAARNAREDAAEVQRGDVLARLKEIRERQQ